MTGDKVSYWDKFKLHHPTFPKVTVQVVKYRGRNAAAKSKLPRPRADHCAILSLQLRGPCSCLLNSESNGLKRLLQKWEAASHQYHLVKKQTALGNTMAILYLNDWEAEKSLNPTIIWHNSQENEEASDECKWSIRQQTFLLEMANGIRDLRFTSESRFQRGFSIARLLSEIHQVKV